MAADDSSSRYVLLDELAEEFAARYRRGERPSLQEYIDRYPDLAEDIRKLFPAMAEIEQAKADKDRAESPDPAAPPPLQQIGDFRIIREIGRGGMGVVYEAEQMSLGRRVALKVLPRGGPLSRGLKHRFEREARAAARLHHTNIVPVFGVGEHEGVPYFAMQYIQGQGLDAVIAELARMQNKSPAPAGQSTPAEYPEPDVHSAAAVARSLLRGSFKPEVVEGDCDAARAAATPTVVTPSSSLATPASEPPPLAPVPLSSSSLLGSGATGSGLGQSERAGYWRHVASIGAQVADGLAYAHAKGILHRDIKPSNLLLDTRGTIWIADFGLAKVEGQQNLTHTGDIIGTLRYMPPEAFNGKTDARSDVYSAGLTLYELLTLEPAFAGINRLELISRISAEEPARPRSLDRRVPADLETIVLKAIEKDPDRRYQTAGELADDLRHFAADEPIKARRMTRPERLWRWCRHHKAVAALSATLLAGLVLTAAGSLGAAYRFARLAAQEAAARRDAEEARTEAEESYRQARQAVDDNLTRVSESSLLRVPGLQPLRKDLLGMALKYYQGFLARHGDDPALRNELADAFARTARITADIGSREEAIRLQEKGMSLRRGLHEQSPGDLSLSLHLADDDLALSALRRQAGDPDAARRSYQDAYGLLLTVSPQEFKARGQVGMASGCFAVGIKEHASNDPEILRHFADTLLEASAVESAAGERLRAVTKLLEFLYAQQSLVARHADHPQHVRFRQRLASGWLRQGKLMGELGQIQEAIAAHGEARILYDQLVREHPPALDAAELRHNLAAADANVGSLHARVGRLREAIAAYEQAQPALRKLADENPAVTEFQAELAQTFLELGEARGRDGDGAVALSILREGLERQKSLAGSGRDPSRARGLVRYHLALARVYQMLDRPAEAVASYRAGRRALEGLPPAAAEDWYLLAVCRAGCATESALARPDLVAGAAAARGAWSLVPSTVLARQAPDFDRAADALRRAASAGHAELDRFASARELNPLRDRADYRALVAEIARRRTNDLWAADFDAAKERAAREKKDLLLYFCGSDWDGADKALREKYLDGAVNRALAAELVAVEFDSPKYGAVPRNHALCLELFRRWKVGAWPSMVLADASGRPYARLREDVIGNEDWSPEVFVAKLRALREVRYRRDELLARAAGCQGAGRAAALDRALDTLLPEFVGEYADEVREIVRLDPTDAAGLRTKYLYATAGNHLFDGVPGGAAAARAKSKEELMTPPPEGEVRRFNPGAWRYEVAWPARYPVTFSCADCCGVTLQEMGGRVEEDVTVRAALGSAAGSVAALLRSWREPEIKTFTEARGGIWGLALSADGLRLLTCGFDGTAHLWDRRTGKELRHWEISSREWVQVAISPDARFAACGAADGVVRLLNLESDRPPLALPGHTGPARAVAFAADSRRLISGGDDGTLRLWDVDTGREVRRFKGPADGLVRVTVSPDGRHILACYNSATAALWDYETGQLLRQVQFDSTSVDRHTAAFTPDGRHFLTGSGAALALWDTDTGREAFRFDTPAGVCGLAIAPDGRHAITSSADGVFRIYPLTEEAARASKLMRTGPADRAIEAWNQVIASEPQEPGVYLARARLYARRGQWDETVADVARAARLDPFDPAVCADAGRIADVLLEELGTWTVLEPKEMQSERGATLTRLPDGSVLAGGPNEEQDAYTVVARPSARGITAVRLEVLPDPSLPHNGPGRAPPDGTFILTGFSAKAGGRTLEWSGASASHSQEYYPITSLAATYKGAWAILPLAGQAHSAVFTLKGPVGEGKDFEIRFQLQCESVMAQRNLGRFRLSYTTRPPALAHLENAGASTGNGWVRLAVARALRGEWREALSAAGTPAADPADGVSLRLLRSLAYDQLGEHEKAKEAYESAASGAAVKAGVVPLAMAAASERIAHEPGSAGLRLDRARWYADLGQRGDALADFAAARRLNPSLAFGPADAPLLFASANKAAGRGEWEEASVDLSRAIELSGGSAVDWYRLALLRYQSGDVAGYRRARATVFARFGQDKDSAMQVASTGELEPGDADDLGPVLAAAEGLVKLHPKDPLAARHLGAAYLRAGKVEAAIDELTRAAMLRKHTPVPWLLLAIAHHRAGHDGEGRQWLIKAQQFLDLAQKNPDAAVDGGNIVWNRLSWSERLKVQLFRREAEAALGEIAASGK